MFSKKYFLFTETPATATERISFDTKDIHEKYPAAIRMTWSKENLTTNAAATIRISIWGYRETTIKPQLEYIDLLEVSSFKFLRFYSPLSKNEIVIIKIRPPCTLKFKIFVKFKLNQFI